MKSSRPGQTPARKKARWSRAQKVEAQRAAVRKQVKGSRPGAEDRRDRPRRDSRDGESRSYGDRGDQRSNRSFGERRDQGERRSYGENRSYGDRGDQRSNRSFGERRDQGERRSYGENRSYGDRGDQRSHRSYGERRDQGERRSYGKTRWSDNDRPARDQAPREQGPGSTKPPRHERIDLSNNGFAALGLPNAIAERLARDGITTPFPIQAATIPDALAGKDVLGRGRTGSGKTLSFGLPTLARLAAGGKARPQQPRAIVLTPTRELAMQVSDALQPLVHVVGLRHKLVAGGMPYEPQLQALERGVDLLIATPGRLMDLMERGAADLSRVEVAILDEADHMAEMGFLEAITEILDQVPEGGQRLLFSATLDRGIDGLVDKYLIDPVTHSTDDAQAAVTTMVHHALLIEPRDKKAVTAQVANRPGRTVVFCRTKLGADRVAAELRELGVVAAALHGGLNQGQRNKVLSAFKDGRVPVLVATDVAARGIHVDDVGVVLQIDPPADHKDYLHRAGRTARAGEDGTVVTLALPHQRRSVQRLLDDAGVDVQLQKARPGDAVIAEAGGSTPDGRPVTEADLRHLLQPRGAGGSRGSRRPGGPGSSGRGGYRGDRSHKSQWGRGRTDRAAAGGRAPRRDGGARD